MRDFFRQIQIGADVVVSNSWNNIHQTWTYFLPHPVNDLRVSHMQEWTFPGRKVLAGTCRRVGRALAHFTQRPPRRRSTKVRAAKRPTSEMGKRLGPEVQLRFVGQSSCLSDLMISGGGAYELAIWGAKFSLRADRSRCSA